MRVIIAGSRDLTDRALIDEAVEESLFEIDTVISGGARGVDALAIDWADDNKKHLIVMNADWEKYGTVAGIRRNIDMAETADALIAIWNGKSRGTRHMIEVANQKDLRVYVKLVKTS